MRYLLPKYDIKYFHRLDDLARLCYTDPTGKGNLPTSSLRQIGDTEVGLSYDNLDYIEANSSPDDQLNGVCFHEGNNAFKIWLNPDMDPKSMLFDVTLLHELCHGYLGPNSMHGRDWRRYFGVALVMYSRLINPKFTDAEWQVRHTIRRYRTEEDPIEDFNVFNDGCNFEEKAVKLRVEANVGRIRTDLYQLQEMREGCHSSTSATTPTPAYLASLPRKAGTGSPLK